MTYTFKRLINAKKALKKPLLAIDIENNPVTGKFINAAVYGDVKDTRGNIHKVNKYFPTQAELLNYLDGLKNPKVTKLPCTLIFFNLAYDYWFLSGITDDAQMLSSGSRIITGKLKNGIPMLDLTNQVQGSLEDWIGHLNLKKKGIKKETLDNLKIRVKSDTRATYEVGKFIQDFYVDQLNIPLRLTVASSARYLFASGFFTDYWFRDEKRAWVNNYERQGYRGGRCEVFKRGKRHVCSYDVNSEYLSVMHDEMMPDPNTAKYHKTGFDINMPELFLADVTVHVPQQHIPPLPYKKDKKPTSKLIFPVGTFRGKYYSPELKYAVKECEVKILEVHSYITYKSKPYFEDYAKFVWSKRREYKDKGNKGMDIMIKYLGNTLYGSFGQQNSEYNYFGKVCDCNYEISEGDIPNVTKINGVEYISIANSKKYDSTHTFPCIPGFITSYARLKLYKGMKANGYKLVYCDTDAIKVEIYNRKNVKGIVVGSGLGEWGFEYEAVQEFNKPKVYEGKVKGVPKRAELVYNENGVKTYVYKKPYKMRESFKRGLIPAKWDYFVKEMELLDDKRTWDSKARESKPLSINNITITKTQ